MVKINKEIFDEVTKLIGQCDISASNDEYVYIDEQYIDGILEDIMTEYHRKEEELEDEIEQRKEFYKPKSAYEIYGISENDFI